MLAFEWDDLRASTRRIWGVFSHVPVGCKAFTRRLIGLCGYSRGGRRKSRRRRRVVNIELKRIYTPPLNTLLTLT